MFFLEEADETAEKVEGAEGGEGEGKFIQSRTKSSFLISICYSSAESPARGKKRKHEGGD